MSLNKPATTAAIYSPLTNLTLPPVPLNHLNIYRLPTFKENIHSPFAHLHFFVVSIYFLTSLFPQH